MADLSDVETVLASAIVQIVYPGGISVPSITGEAIKVFRGWPTSIGLNADLASGVANISVFSDPKTTRETTRYPRVWRPRSFMEPTLTAIVSGQTVTFGGTGGSGQVAGIEADDDVCSVLVGQSDTPVSVAARLAAGFSGVVQNGASLTFAGAAKVVSRVAGSGTSVMETRRQEQGFVVSIWCSDPATRDSIAASLDASLSLIDWLQFPDGSAGQLRYKETSEIDTSENANLYRRDLLYTVEYPTVVATNTSAMLFGLNTLFNYAATENAVCTKVAPSRPLLGAIRFDAWYDPQDSIDQQCASALSPAQWATRLPPNSVFTGGQVAWPLAEQATLDAEISAAMGAGIDFWAFDSYQPGDGLGRALSLYLSSSLRSRLQFCMVGQASNWADPATPTGYSAALARDVAMMSQQNYLKVLDGRPVYFVLNATLSQTASLPGNGLPQALTFIRQQATGNGQKNPYIVWLSAAALADYDNVTVAREVGADAAGAYACPRLSGATQTYSDLVVTTEADWLARSVAGLGMVGTAMTGWDQRPLIENPQPFYPLAPGLTDADFYTEGAAVEIAEHIADLVTFTTDNPSSCEAGLALIYAWNELAEGGWLMPTYLPGGSDTSRVQALGLCLSSRTGTNSGSRTIIV